MTETTDDLPARLEAVLTERFTELGNPFSAMRRHEKGPDGWPASHPVGPHHVAEVLRKLLAAAPVPPPAPTDRAAFCHEAAERITAYAADHFPDEYDEYADRLADALRRMADEAQQQCPGFETQPNRCSCDCEGCRHNCAAHQPTP